VIMLASIDCNRWILLVMALDIKLLLMVQLVSIDRGGYILTPIAQHRQRCLVDVVIHQHNRFLGLLFLSDDIYIEYYAKNAYYSLLPIHPL